MGELPNFGIYRAKQQHTPPQDACFNTDRQWLEELLQSRPPPQHEAQLVFDKSQQERQLGILERWFSPEDLRCAVWGCISGILCCDLRRGKKTTGRTDV